MFSLLSLWKDEYSRWKHHYERFREYEEHTFFSADDEGNPRPLDGQTNILHKRAIVALLSTGQRCLDNLRNLELKGDEAQERLAWDKRSQTLIDALRDDLRMWHGDMTAARRAEILANVFGISN